MGKELNIQPPSPDKKDGQAIVRVIEKLSPAEKAAADKSRSASDQNPAR